MKTSGGGNITMGYSDEAAVIDGLRRMIGEELYIAANEQAHPGIDPDKSDEKIETALRRAKEYARIRDEIEEVVTGVIRKEDNRNV